LAITEIATVRSRELWSTATGRPAPASCWRPRAAVRRRAVARASADRYGSHGRRWSSPLRRSRTARTGLWRQTASERLTGWLTEKTSVGW